MKNLFNKHPKGLFLLFSLEMWERFSYYGMRALLVLYMIKQLSYSTQQAGNIYGLYTGFVYLTPLLGGYIADKFLGQRKCINIGAILMCLGLFCLSSGIPQLFLLSLFIMIIANGFFKANISSLLGLLYKDNDVSKDSGYTIFYMGINLGALFSPLICGTLAIKYGFQIGFLSAGIGMLIGFLLYKFFENKILGQIGINVINSQKTKEIQINERITKEQKQQIFALLSLMFFAIIFWTCYEQAGSSLTLLAEYSVNRHFLGFNIPTSYFQALNPFYIIILAPIFSLFWNHLNSKNKEPNSVEKFTTALLLISLSYFYLGYISHIYQNELIPSIVLFILYFLLTIAELCISPIGLSLVSKLAPKQFLSLLMGTWFLTSFFGNLLAGFWGGKYGTISNELLFLTLALISFMSFIVLFILRKNLQKIIGKC